MGKSVSKTLKRTYKRQLRALRRGRPSSVVAAILVFAVVATIGLTMTGQGTSAPRYPVSDYAALLDTIAKGESRGNYNAYYGNAGNSELAFTNMSVAEVLAWQHAHVEAGSPSSAVGKYQIIRPTLDGLVRELRLDVSARFDAAMQDRLAVALLERRGVNEFRANKISREQFAANLSQEWAALPSVTGAAPNESYYAGDGLNKALISVDEIYGALALVGK